MFLPEFDPTYDPLEHLDRGRVRLVKRVMFHSNAVWIPDRQTVVMNAGLRSDLVRPTLAHECFHAENNDFGGHHPKNEARADLHSALRLIDPTEWDRLAGVQEDYDAMCIELGITRRQFRKYHEHRRWGSSGASRLERYGNTIYVDPKMGVGQWKQKVEVA